MVAFPENIRLGWKSLTRSNTLAYYEMAKYAVVKSFTVQAPWFGFTSMKNLKFGVPSTCTIKLFTTIIYRFS
jgi:hypothetical protein